MMAEIMGQTQNTGHVATAHFGSRFADFAVELRVFFDDQDARFRSLVLQHKRGCGAGKGATDDYDVVFEIHWQQREWTLERAKAISSSGDVTVGGLRYRGPREANGFPYRFASLYPTN